MSDDGRKLTDAEKREWLHSKGQIRRGPHQMKQRICHWLYCGRCGLVLLRNEVSRKAASKQCEWEDD